MLNYIIEVDNMKFIPGDLASYTMMRMAEYTTAITAMPPTFVPTAVTLSVTSIPAEYCQF
jgi:hypothetical protein